MQFPGMSTEPVRVSLEVTWWPASGDWSIARRGWRRDHDNSWRLEEMATSGTPLSLSEVVTRLQHAVDALVAEIEASDDPFSTVGAFR